MRGKYFYLRKIYIIVFDINIKYNLGLEKMLKNMVKWINKKSRYLF